jgi:uncharacterized protein (DUF2164 family)
MAIEFPREARSRLVESIQRYFSEKLDSSIGNLDAEFLLEFFVKEIGPAIYNQAVRDAQAVLQDRVVELDAICFEGEEGYWDSPAPGKPR